jgi:hypothetical protein
VTVGISLKPGRFYTLLVIGGVSCNQENRESQEGQSHLVELEFVDGDELDLEKVSAHTDGSG